MKHDDHGLDPELKAFLTPRSIERRMPADLRARALANGRAIVAAGGTLPAASLAAPPPPLRLGLKAPVARSPRLFRLALAASIAVAMGAVGAMAALYNRSQHAPPTPLPADPRPTPAAHEVPVAAPADEPVAVERTAPPKAARAARASTEDDAVTAELVLLQRAHAAYTRRDFSDALVLVAEHARRFPKGHLAEQREALRVRSLAGSGRTDEAHRAAADFAVRFPRSVLLPRVTVVPNR